MKDENQPNEDLSLDLLLKEHARALPSPPAEHEALFFAKLAKEPRKSQFYIRTALAAGVMAAAAAWFLQVKAPSSPVPPEEELVLIESVQSYNDLVEDDDDIYALVAEVSP